MSTIRELIDAQAAERNDQPFLLTPESGTALSYGQVLSAVQEIGARLTALGIGPGAKVAFMMDNGPWTAMLFLGVMYSGRVVVPLNAVAGQAALEHVLEHSDSELLFASPGHLEKLRPALEKLAKPPRILQALEEGGPEWPVAAAAEGLGPVSEDDIALLIYTSGTTGKPKGVLLTQRNVVAGGRNTATAHNLTASDRALCVLPLYHINGEIVTVIAPLVSGGSVVMPRRFSATSFWGLIAEHQCTWFSVVPTIISYLLDQAEREDPGVKGGARFRQLRFGRSASAALPPEQHLAFEERFHVPLIETMGLSETAAQILSNPMPPATPKVGSPGVAVGNEAKTVDGEGRDQPAGEIGELLIRGPNVMQGYYKNPEATRDTIDSEGWLHTGDLAYRDEEGFFFITGRIKELIIRGGENIAPREIDEVLYNHPAVLEAAAFGVPDKHYGQEVMACVALKPGATCSEEELRQHCVAALGAYKAPKRISVMPELPKGPSGKIQRLQLANASAT
jgi:acyl-CoA synthetase (AMP-forming)/AMP-acid ligase II